MTSTSAEGVVLRGLPDTGAPGQPGTANGDLRTGTWTRFGGDGILGDAVTEVALAALAERASAAGRAQGYAAGWAEGRRRALDSARAVEADQVEAASRRQAAQAAEHELLVAALTDATQRCVADFAVRYDALADAAVELALRIAEEVLQRELAVANEPGLDALRRALAQVRPDHAVVVRMNPADRAQLDPAALDGRPVTLVDDPSLAPGQGRAKTQHKLVDTTK
ncbi:MAG: FliH/SctL family protein [Nocardioides sp.]